MTYYDYDPCLVIAVDTRQLRADGSQRLTLDLLVNTCIYIAFALLDT
jgi:hypothetical protein